MGPTFHLFGGNFHPRPLATTMMMMIGNKIGGSISWDKDETDGGEEEEGSIRHLMSDSQKDRKFAPILATLSIEPACLIDHNIVG